MVRNIGYIYTQWYIMNTLPKSTIKKPIIKKEQNKKVESTSSIDIRV
jgi:hypothetical protein